MNCVNCNQPVVTAYCPTCGQRIGVKRITFRDTLKDFWMQVAGLDGIFLRTLRDLTLRPGLVALRYIAGVRVAYLGPIGYFFFMITLLLLWISVLGLDFAELIRDKQQDLTFSEASQRGSQWMTRLVSDHIKWVLFLAVPFQAFAARFFYFRRSGFNLIEHTVPLFYTAGHLFWLTILLFTYKSYFSDVLVIPSTVLSLAYFGYMYSDFMRYQPKWKSFLKGLAVYLTGQALFAITLGILIALFIVVASVVDPSILDPIRPSRQ